VLHGDAVCCSVSHCVTACSNILQCCSVFAVCCSVLQCVSPNPASEGAEESKCSVVQSFFCKGDLLYRALSAKETTNLGFFPQRILTYCIGKIQPAQCGAVWCIVLQRVAVFYSVSWRVAACCSVLQRSVRVSGAATAAATNAAPGYTLQHTAAHYSTLQHTATHCNTLTFELVQQ